MSQSTGTRVRDKALADILSAANHDLSAYLFFRSQGLPACAAFALMRAEAFAEDAGLTFDWEWDGEGAADWYCECGCVPEDVLGCICRNGDGEHLASLWSIGDPDDAYRRVVEAELALRVMEER